MTTASPGLSSPFVVGDCAPLQTVLVFPAQPELAQLTPLPAEPGAIAVRAAEQFAVFVKRLASAGVRVIEAAPELAAFSPFGADGAVVFPDGAFLMRPSDVRLRAASAELEKTLAAAGVPIVGRIDAPGLLDGGDVLWSGSTVYLGVTHARQAETGIPARLRGNALGRAQLAAYARERGFATTEVSTAAEVRRLRSVAAFVDERTVLAASGLLDANAFSDCECIEVKRGEDYAAGVLALGKRRVLANLRFRETLPALRASGIIVDAIDVWEFGKVGATPSSMVLALKRG